MEHPEAPEAFISYSHDDEKWLDELLRHLKPLKDRNLLDCWSDKEISSGQLWQEEIKRALASAKVAILLVSPSFLASSFIAQNELPPLLKAAHNGTMKVIWIPVSSSNYRHTEIAAFQAAHPPDKPLDMLRKAERQRALVDISEKILNAAANSSQQITSVMQQDKEGQISITIESVHTAQTHSLLVEPKVSIRWLSDKAQSELGVSSSAKTGAYESFLVRWVLVDTRAEDVWRSLGRDEQRRLYALIRSARGLRFCYSDRDRLEDLELYDGIVFHLYAIEDEGALPPPAKYGF